MRNFIIAKAICRPEFDNGHEDQHQILSHNESVIALLLKCKFSSFKYVEMHPLKKWCNHVLIISFFFSEKKKKSDSTSIIQQHLYFDTPKYECRRINNWWLCHELHYYWQQPENPLVSQVTSPVIFPIEIKLPSRPQNFFFLLFSVSFQQMLI